MEPVFNVVDALEALCKKCGSSLPQYRLCKIVKETPGLMLTELCHRMGAANTTMTNLVDRAERHGWVRRVRSAHDRRVIIVELADPIRFNALDSLVQEAVGHIPHDVTEYLNITAKRLVA